jgi:hypothetical protein
VGIRIHFFLCYSSNPLFYFIAELVSFILFGRV